MTATPRDFTPTQPNALSDEPVVRSKAAGWPTRVVYCTALLALVMGQLGQGSWVGLATGGGLLGWAGTAVFSLVAAVMGYRIYLVLRYQASLQARQPNALGWVFRWLGWAVMLVGALALVAMFLVKPLALLIFKSAGPNGIAFFVVGLYAAMLSGAGWLGCVLFELSRVMGKRATAPVAPKTPSQRRQDYGVAATVAVLVMGFPYALRMVVGAPCYGPNLTRCTATVQGGVVRPAVVPFGDAVTLETNVDEIVFARKAQPPVEIKESPRVSLLKSGHPAQPGATSPVRVVLNAVALGKGVAVTLQVLDAQGESARFVTTFQHGARLQPGQGGKQRIVVDLPAQSNAARQTVITDPATQQRYVLDEVFSQMRQAIYSPREAAEWSLRVARPARELSATPIERFDKFEDARPGSSCKDTLRREPGNAETNLFPNAGSPLFRLVFLESPDQQGYMLMQPFDSVGCNAEGVWAFKAAAANGQFEIRHYSPQGQLLHFVATTLPMDKDQGTRIDVDSARALGATMTFTAVDIAAKGPTWKRKLMEVTF